MVAAFHSCSTKIQKFPSLGEGDKRWVPPRPGLLKLNIDTTYCQFTARAGYGCIICNDLGQVVAFSCGRYEGALSAQHAEIMALKDGLLLAVSRGLVLDCVECDALNVVSDVNIRNFDSIFGVLLEDIVELLVVVGGGSCRHISRYCNMVAHTLAAMGLRSLGCLVGDGNLFLVNLFDVLHADLN